MSYHQLPRLVMHIVNSLMRQFFCHRTTQINTCLTVDYTLHRQGERRTDEKTRTGFVSGVSDVGYPSYYFQGTGRDRECPIKSNKPEPVHPKST